MQVCLKMKMVIVRNKFMEVPIKIEPIIDPNWYLHDWRCNAEVMLK